MDPEAHVYQALEFFFLSFFFFWGGGGGGGGGGEGEVIGAEVFLKGGGGCTPFCFFYGKVNKCTSLT